ncbi:MAG: chorismate mutase [Holophagales bacterium]|jgi:chorismate mutase/prephenate dehydratase|nr:chorismate mutase [Holophagales bacterium]
MNPVFNYDINGFRGEIDNIDDQLLALLNQRAKIAIKLGELKTAVQAEDIGFRVSSRENSIIERLEQTSTGPFPVGAIKMVFNEIFKACLSIQKYSDSM